MVVLVLIRAGVHESAIYSAPIIQRFRFFCLHRNSINSTYSKDNNDLRLQLPYNL